MGLVADGYCYADAADMGEAWLGRVHRAAGNDYVVDGFSDDGTNLVLWLLPMDGTTTPLQVAFPRLECLVTGPYGLPAFQPSSIDLVAIADAWASGFTLAMIPLATIWAVKIVLKTLR